MTWSIHHLKFIAVLMLTAFVSIAHAEEQRQLPIIGTFTVVGSNSCQATDGGYSAYPGLYASGNIFAVSNS